MEKLKELGRGALARGGAVAALAVVASGSAMAALPTEVTDGITAAGDDLVAAATAVITALIGFWALRKVGQKMGWW